MELYSIVSMVSIRLILSLIKISNFAFQFFPNISIFILNLSLIKLIDIKDVLVRGSRRIGGSKSGFALVKTPRRRITNSKKPSSLLARGFVEKH